MSVVELVLLFALDESDPLQEMKTKRLRIIIATKEIFISKLIKKKIFLTIEYQRILFSRIFDYSLVLQALY